MEHLSFLTDIPDHTTSSTGSSPAEWMMGHKLTTQLDLMYPDPRKKV